MLDTNNSLEDLVRFGVFGGRGNNSGTIDEVNPSHEGDVLPTFGLSSDRSSLADGLLLKSVDDTRFTDIGVSDESDGNLLLVGEEGRKLTKKLDKRSLSEGVVDGSVESDGRVSF